MTAGKISQRVVADRMAWVQDMLKEIENLPLHDRTAFFSDSRNVWTSESCLRRALEALLDAGRHILAKGFAAGVGEYKEITTALLREGVLTEEEARLLRVLAGYRNRLVHFYHEISREELLEICSNHLGDLRRLVNAYAHWLLSHPEKVDGTL